MMKKLDGNRDGPRDGRLTLAEFSRFVNASKKLAGVKVGLMGRKKRHPPSSVKTIREHISALEQSSTVTSLRLLPPLPLTLATALTRAMRYVDTDLTREGLYRAAPPRKNAAVAKCMEIMVAAPAGRVSAADLGRAAGGDTRIVAVCIARFLSRHAPLVPYELFDSLSLCVTGADLSVFVFENFGKVPTLAADVLGSFALHLADVLKHKNLNGMDVAPLAVPLGPLLFRRDEDLRTSADGTKTLVRLFGLMLANADDLFADREEFLWGPRDRPDPRRRPHLPHSGTPRTVPTFKAGGDDDYEEEEETKREEVRRIMGATEESLRPSRW